MRSNLAVSILSVLLFSVVTLVNADGVALREPPYNVYAWRKKYDFPKAEGWTLRKLIQCGTEEEALSKPLSPNTRTVNFMWASNELGTHYRLLKTNTNDGSVDWIRNFYFSDSFSSIGEVILQQPTCATQDRLLIVTTKRILVLDTSDDVKGTIHWAVDLRNYGDDYTITNSVSATPDASFDANSNSLATYDPSYYFYVMWYSRNSGTTTSGFDLIWTIASFDLRHGRVGEYQNFTDVNDCDELSYGRASNVHLSFQCSALSNTVGRIHLRWLVAPADIPYAFDSTKVRTVTPDHSNHNNNTLGPAQILGEQIFLAFTPHGVILSWGLGNGILQVNHNFVTSSDTLVDFRTGKNPADGNDYVFAMTSTRMTTYAVGNQELVKTKEKIFSTQGGLESPSVVGVSLVVSDQWALGDLFISSKGSSWSYLYRFSLTNQEFIWCSQLPNKDYAVAANLPLGGSLIGSDYVFIQPQESTNPVVAKSYPSHKYYQADYTTGELTLGLGMESGEPIITYGWDVDSQRPTFLSQNYLRQFVPTAAGRVYTFEGTMQTSDIFNDDLYVTEGSTLRRFSTNGNMQGNTDGSFNGVPSISTAGVENSFSNSNSHHSSSFAETSSPITPSPGLSTPVPPTTTPVPTLSSDGVDCPNLLKDGTPSDNYRSPIEVWYINLVGTMKFLSTKPVLMEATQELIYAAKDDSVTPVKYYWVKFHAQTGRYIRRILVTGQVASGQGSNPTVTCDTIDGVKIYVDQAKQDIFWVATGAKCLVRMDRYAVFTGSVTTSSISDWVYLTPDSRYVLTLGTYTTSLPGAASTSEEDTEVIRFDRRYFGNKALGQTTSLSVIANLENLACGEPSNGLVAYSSIWVVCGRATNMLISFNVESLLRQSHTSLWGSGLATDFGRAAPFLYEDSIYIPGNTGTLIKTTIENGINASVTIDWTVQTKSNYSLGDPHFAPGGGFVFAADKSQGLYLITAWGTLVWEMVDTAQWGQYENPTTHHPEFDCSDVTISSGVIVALCNQEQRYINLYDGTVQFSGPVLSAAYAAVNFVTVVGGGGGGIQQVYQITSKTTSYTEFSISFGGSFPGAASSKGLSAGAVAGVVIASVAATAGILGVIAYFVIGGGAAALAAKKAASNTENDAANKEASAPLLKGAATGPENSSYTAPTIVDNDGESTTTGTGSPRGEEMSPSQQRLSDEERK